VLRLRRRARQPAVLLREGRQHLLQGRLHQVRGVRLHISLIGSLKKVRIQCFVKEMTPPKI
jgi:hypothetical protein